MKKIRLKYRVKFPSDKELILDVMEFDKEVKNLIVRINEWWIVPAKTKPEICFKTKIIFLGMCKGVKYNFESKDHRDSFFQELKSMLKFWVTKAY